MVKIRLKSRLIGVYYEVELQLNEEKKAKAFRRSFE